MNRLLSHEGVLYRVLDLWWTVTRLGLIWWLASIPVVTSPAATIWLLHAVRREMRGERTPGLRSSIELVRQLSVQTYRLVAVGLATAGLILLAALAPSPPGVLSQVLVAVVVCVGVLWCLVIPWSLAILERRGAGVRDALATAYVTSMRKPVLAAGAALGISLCLSAPLWIPTLGKPLALISAPALAAALLVRTVDEASLVDPPLNRRRVPL